MNWMQKLSSSFWGKLEFSRSIHWSSCNILTLLRYRIMKLKKAFVFLDTSSTDVDTIWDRIQRLDVSYVVISSRNVASELSVNFSTTSTVQICEEKYEIWRRKKRKHGTNKNDFAFAVFSSGSTTDRPKIIRVPHACIMPNVLDLRLVRCNSR